MIPPASSLPPFPRRLLMFLKNHSLFIFPPSPLNLFVFSLQLQLFYRFLLWFYFLSIPSAANTSLFFRQLWTAITIFSGADLQTPCAIECRPSQIQSALYTGVHAKIIPLPTEEQFSFETSFCPPSDFGFQDFCFFRTPLPTFFLI